MLNKAIYFLFSVFFLTVFNGYAEDVAVESNDAEMTENEVTSEVSSNEAAAEVAENTESSECSEESSNE